MVEQVGRFVGPAYNVRLEDVKDAALIEGVCLLCRHAGPIDLFALAAEKKWHPRERLVWIERQLRCQECKLSAAKLRITWQA